MRRLYVSLLVFCSFNVFAQSVSVSDLDSMIVETKDIYYTSPSTALLMSRKILSLSDSINYENGRLEGLRWIGNSHYLMGRLDSAMHYMLLLLDETYKYGNRAIQADVMLDIGQTYDKIGLYSLSYDYLRQAHEIRLEIGDAERLSVTFINLAYHYYLRDELDTALYLYQRTETILDTIPLTFTKPFLYNEVGGVYLKQGRYQEARDKINQALELNIQLENNWDLSYSYVMLAQLEYLVGNTQEAEQSALKALSISRDNNISLEYDIIFKILSDVKGSQGLHNKALDYLEKSYSYRDSLNLALMDQKILALDYYKGQKENEIQTLKLVNDNLAQETQLKGQRYLLIAGALILSLTLIGILVLYNQKNQLVLAQKKIRDQNQTLKELNVTKNKLFSVITHDIRNPLSNINSMLQLARDGLISPEDFSKFAGSMIDQTDRISSLSTTLIDWSKSQLSSLSAEKSEVDLDQLIESSVKDLRFLADGKNVNLICDGGRLEQPIMADPSMLLLVINNLLTNAIKFTPEGGEVTIVTQAIDGETTIQVKDSGVGIQANLIDQLKEGKVESELGTSGEKGTGIGLTLTMDLVTLQGGTLEAYPNPDGGSTFVIKLPSI